MLRKTLPKELTASQEKLPDLNSAQLESLGFSDNFIWKLNAKMLGYKEGMDIDDLIEEKIQTYPKGDQVIFYFHGIPANKLPIALGGEFVLQQKYQMKNGEGIEPNNCVFDSIKKMLIFLSLPEDSTEEYIIIYGKVVLASVPKKDDSEYETSMENITNKLTEIDRVKKENEFREANKLPTAQNRYRVPTKSLKQ